ncbi:MAG: hypothetical protein AAGG48_19695 [Planctomycetota bacterium]
MTPPRTVVLLAPVAILGLFAATLLGVDRLAFRDVSHFYTPLYDYVAARMSDQWVPLWNPLDHTGLPLLGETTTAVLYPPKILLYSLPIASTTALAWYVVFHLILAVFTSYQAARWSSVSTIAAVVASVVYPLSGVVLFLYCNPPFLCGAAWLPLLVGALISTPDWTVRKRTIVAGTTMAMMVLAGDPQTAAHGLILSAVVWSVRWVGRSSIKISGKSVLLSPALAVLLAAPQIAASLSWSAQSERVAEATTRSWWQPPVVGSLRHQAFQFSLPPWHFAELATPQPYGSLLPEHRRLSSRMPGDGRMWTPTIYMGLLVLFAILSRLWRLRTGGGDAWMLILFASAWLAMGHFGLVWLVQTNSDWLSEVDSAVGGAYWFLYQLLPGYDAFRYPSKWLSVFALGASMVTAKGVDEWMKSERLDRWPFLAVGAIIAIGLLTSVSLSQSAWPVDPGVRDSSDVFWGPLQMANAWSEIISSWLHSWLIWVSLGAVFWIVRQRQWPPVAIGYGLLLVTLLDVSSSARELIYTVTVPQEQEVVQKYESKLVVSPSDDGSRWMRTQSGGGWPSVWRQTTSGHRVLEVEASQRVAWFGRWHLSQRIAVLNGMVSIRSHHIAKFWTASRQLVAGLTPQQSDAYWQSVRDWLSIESVRHLTDQSVEQLHHETRLQLVDVRFPPQRTQFRHRVHWDWQTRYDFPKDVEDYSQRLRQLQLDTESQPILSSVDELGIRSDGVGVASIASGMRSAELEELSVTLSKNGLVTRPVFQDGHWQAQYSALGTDDWQGLVVHPVDGLIQGVLLPPGQWQVRFYYWPWWLPWTLAASMIAWVFVCVPRLRWFRGKPSI